MVKKLVLTLTAVILLSGCSIFENEKDAADYKPSPYIYGIGIVWGNWLNLPQKDAEKADAESMEMIKAAGGKAIPLNITWYDIEKEKGKRNWSYLDYQVSEANRLGLETFAYIGLTPDWALSKSVKESKEYFPGIGYRFPPDKKFTKNFENFFTAAAKRYKGKVKYFQFWNEPNGCSWTKPGCANSDQAPEYGCWLKIAYQALKKGNPDCVVSIGGLDYNIEVKAGYKYLEDLYRYFGRTPGGNESVYFDAVAIHPYGNTKTSSDAINWKALEDTRNTMVKYGDSNKKIWINEYGWTTDSKDGKLWYVKDEAEKAKYIKEVLSKLASPEYSYVFQACYLVLTDLPGTPDDGHNYGLCSRNTKDKSNIEITPRESYDAFKDNAL